MRMHKQMRIYTPVSWLVSINAYQWKSSLILFGVTERLDLINTNDVNKRYIMGMY